MLEAVEHFDDLADVARVARLGHDVALGAPGHRHLDVRHAEAGGDRVHPHPALAAAEIQLAEPARDDRPRGFLQIGGDGVLEIEDEAVGGQREGLGDHLLVAAGHEVQRAAAPRQGHGGQAERLRIMALRRARMTRSPCWLRARCSNVTMPHCGRDFDSRLSITSVSA